MHIGKLKHDVNVSTAFMTLAKEDENAAEYLASFQQYRHACYFIIQAMEKFIRAKIFTLVNPNLEYFRDKNRTHSLESAVEFLIEIISDQQVIRDQVSSQLGITRYNALHNNLRYPSYSRRFDNYSILQVHAEDYDRLKTRLHSLQLFLKDLHRLT